MLKIVLTGNIASGKTKIANHFAKLGVPIIDTDKIARAITSPKTIAYKKIISHFGDEFCDKNGNLDRKRLRTIIFSNIKARLWLEELLHPIIYKKMQSEIKKIQSHYCILVIPLLFETKFALFRQTPNRILVVKTSKKIEIERLIKRDKITKSDAKKIIALQFCSKESAKLACDVIVNNGTIKELHQKILLLHKKYLELACS